MYRLIFCVYLCFMCVLCEIDGDECMSERDRIKGRCVDIRRCLSTVNDIKRKKWPQICSFKGHEPIICCTDCELVNDTSIAIVNDAGAHYFKTGQKAADKCLEYITTLDYPCTLRTGLRRQLFWDMNCYTYQTPLILDSVGGIDATVGQYPHMALLGYGDDIATAEWLCGGSVISDSFILTAAHCISSASLGPVRFVALGILKRSDPPEQWQRYSVRRIIPHPEYRAPKKYHDIALLEVDKIKFNYLVVPACLNTEETGTWAEATGWGALGYRQALADTLQVVFLQRYSAEECSAAYPPHRHLPNGYDHNTQTCYGDKEKIIDTCEGDSGGPLQERTEYGRCVFKIIGVTSYGRACGFQGTTGMYTRVAYYVPWIESIVWP